MSKFDGIMMLGPVIVLVFWIGRALWQQHAVAAMARSAALAAVLYLDLMILAYKDLWGLGAAGFGRLPSWLFVSLALTSMALALAACLIYFGKKKPKKQPVPPAEPH